MAVAVGLALIAPAASGQPVHGLAMHGQPKHPPGFTHFPYVDPSAPKGGRLVLGMLGSFDSLNPFIIRGVSASGLREYVFESLMASSGDEPFTLYGLIAESIELPADRAFITFNLRPEARFADGKPITPEDVLFSHQVLKEKGWPYHRSHYGKVAKAEKVGERSVRFTFERAGDREAPLLLGLMPILPSHQLTTETFDRTTLEAPLGSGPYTVARVDTGRSIPSCAGVSTSTRSAWSTTAMPPRCSRRSRSGTSTCASRTIRDDGSRAIGSARSQTGA
jgi:peptide/nickel transport system substrate-binding protein